MCRKHFILGYEEGYDKGLDHGHIEGYSHGSIDRIQEANELYDIITKTPRKMKSIRVQGDRVENHLGGIDSQDINSQDVESH